MDVESLVSFLRDWKEVVGAVIGGVLGVLGAMVVARDARNREDRAAALAVMAPLVDLRAHYSAARKAAGEIMPPPRDEDDAALRFAALLAAYPLTLPESFSRAAERIAVVHPHVAQHLALINTRWASIRIALNRLAKYSEHAGSATAKENRRHRSDMLMDARTLTNGLRGTVNDAACVVRLLQCLMQSRFRVWHRLRMRLSPDAIERQCSDALRSGTYPSEFPKD